MNLLAENLDICRNTIDRIKSNNAISVRPLLCVRAAGCGFTLANLLSVPGASSVVGYLDFPYSTEAIDAFCPLGKPEKYLSREVSESLAAWNLDVDYTNFYVGITGAIATLRERKGDDKVYVSLPDMDKGWKMTTYEFSFRKYDPNSLDTVEDYRQICDSVIFRFVMERYNDFVDSKNNLHYSICRAFSDDTLGLSACGCTFRKVS